MPRAVRYRASRSFPELIDDVLAARQPVARRTPVRSTPAVVHGGSENVADIQTRLKARETPQPRFCWHCRKALHARTDKCPFCGETQKARGR